MKGTSNVIYTIITVFANIVAFGILMLFIVGEAILPDERTFADLSSENYSEGWSLVNEDGSLEPIAIPADLNLEGPAKYTIVKTIDTWDDKEAILSFTSAKQDVTAYVDGRMRYSYSTKDTRWFGKSSPDILLFIKLYPSDQGKELKITFEGDNAYTGIIAQMHLGTQLEILLSTLVKENVDIIGAFMLIFMGVASFAMGVFIRITYKRRNSIAYLGMSVFFAGIWMIAESSFRQFIVPNFSLLASMTYLSIMMLALTFALYFDSLQEGRYRLFYMLACMASIFETVIGLMLQYTGQADLVETLPVSFGILVADFTIYIITVIPDIIKGYVKEYLLEFIGILGGAASGFFTMYTYFKDPTNINGSWLCGGLLFVIIMAYMRTFRTILRMERSVNAAVQAQEASNEFLARMSHEMRTPINAILGMNKMILKECSDPDILEYARDVNSAGNYLLSVVNEILDLSKVTSGTIDVTPEEYDLIEMVRECYSLISPKAKASRLAFSVELDDVLPSRLRGDKSRIVQVITNLLSNAIKYTPEGRITLSITGKITSGMLKLIISVSDTGVGISEEDLPYVFDSFRKNGGSEEAHIEGTGLGLTITKELVELMEGSISVDSTLGKGTTFAVVIPQGISSIEPCGSFSMGPNGDRRVTSRTENITYSGKVLVVDDVAINLRVFDMLLKNTGLVVDMAKSGQEAIEKIRKTKYDIIFLDHLMPGMDGIATKTAIDNLEEDINKDTPVIMQTANAVVGAKEEYIRLGFADYIAKPIKEEILLSMLKKYLI